MKQNQVDDEIAISSSSFAPEEHEYNKIKAISYDERTKTTTIQLDTSLLFKHISSETTANGKTIKTAAKVKIKFITFHLFNTRTERFLKSNRKYLTFDFGYLYTVAFT